MPAQPTPARQDYRIFVGAFLTGELAERIHATRQRYDPTTAQITLPHVTLAGTYWRSGRATPHNEAETIARLQALQGHVPPFELVLGGIRTFLPAGKPLIYLSVESTLGLLAARGALIQTLGPDKHGSFIPHLTLAMRLEEAAARGMLAGLHASEWHSGRWRAPIQRLSLMQRGPSDPAWRAIFHLELLSQ